MEDRLLLMIGKDGKAIEYKDEYDIVIHCESKEEQEKVWETITRKSRWIPCQERLPEVGQSVLLSVAGMYTAEGRLRDDGNWCQFRWETTQRRDMVGAWMPLPEPYGGESE